MVKKPSFKDFYSTGYFIYNIKNKKDLLLLKNSILKKSRKLIGKKINPDSFFNNFHKYDIKNNDENYFRLHLMKEINSKFFGAKVGYKIFSEILDKIFGQDIVAQKDINLVIQRPGDESQTTVHRDSPPNSLYEIVVWVPLTKTYKTKNMYILDKDQTAKFIDKIRNSLKKNKNIDNLMNQYFKFAFQKAKSFNLNFGEALIFWAPLVHCVETNKEKTSRWSLNFRYKNTFTPYGTKGFIDYFHVAKQSVVTSLAIEKKSRNIF